MGGRLGRPGFIIESMAESLRKIGTHNGRFHADEVFAVMMLKNFTESFREAEIVRTRDPKLLATLDIVVDVGAVYDPATLRFDHHQKTFTETFSEEFSTKLSSCGLIYRHFGMEILPLALKEALSTGTIATPEEVADINKVSEEFFVEFYRFFIEHIDGVDNGVAQYPPEVKPKYLSHTSDVTWRISRLNEKFWEVKSDPETQRFEKAMAIAKEEFLFSLKSVYFSSYHAMPAVKKAVLGATETHPSGRVIFFGAPISWKDALFKVEKELKLEGHILFVLYPDNESGTYRVQAVGQSSGSFTLRQPLKAEWRGIRDEELAAVSGIADIIFCHQSGFIGGAKTLASALKMAELSIEPSS